MPCITAPNASCSDVDSSWTVWFVAVWAPDGDFVIFIIGMRFNTLWKVHRLDATVDGDVGVHHETYRVSPGLYESITGSVDHRGGRNP